ncbi:ABC transporter ATP-binding protein [Acetobacter conturbans]|uniref:ATP-binding cassette domain-containing protein n=1 Tax=Acetobacter conturbans TaxID=1737472 RepID=A0ABX0K095_9PROT|nr:ABC transporter ATP-binding protein [Acetobacter conturbans]NHN87457.1 ATP-binding cassette domain-containing protein [Acetobacter conturbans]
MSTQPGLVATDLRSSRVGPVTLHVRPGECLAITGPSGSGKSLLLRLLADLDPHTGRVTLDDTDAQSIPGHVWRERVAYFPAEPGWWSEQACDHVADTGAARTLLGSVGLSERMLSSKIHTLSTGERQRLALVRGLLHKPKVLLLDEPTSALDPDSTALVEQMLAGLKRDGTIFILVSHNAAQTRRFADRHFTLRDGRLEEGDAP